MTYDELVANVSARSNDHVARATAAAEGLSVEQFNSPAGKEWSVARVFKHLCLADEPYLKAIEEAVPVSKAGSGEVRHSWVGKLLMKVSGPGGNAPAPAFLIPPELALSTQVIDEWIGYESRLRGLCDMAKGKDLSHKVRNPFLKFLRMNVADLFALMDVHTERHVRQIEERSDLARAQ
jgi:hypothetical protein